MERLDEHYEYMSPAVPLMKKPPSEYMKSEQVYYSFEPDEHTLNFVMDYVGEDRLVFASDYNHGDSKFPAHGESGHRAKEFDRGATAQIDVRQRGAAV